MNCHICKDEGWVCENHPNEKWDYGDQECCGGAGMPCKCNKSDPPWKHEDPSVEIIETNDQRLRDARSEK